MVAERSLAATHGRAKPPPERSNGRMVGGRRIAPVATRSAVAGRSAVYRTRGTRIFVDQLDPRRPSLAYHRLAQGDDTLVEDFSGIDDPTPARENVLGLATCRTEIISDLIRTPAAKPGNAALGRDDAIHRVVKADESVLRTQIAEKSQSRCSNNPACSDRSG